MSYEKFVNELPPLEDWGERIYTRPELQYPESLNAAAELLDRNIAEGRGTGPRSFIRIEVITYGDLLKTRQPNGQRAEKTRHRTGRPHSYAVPK